MKVFVSFGLTIFLLVILSSCGVSKEPCEGVGKISVNILTS